MTKKHKALHLIVDGRALLGQFHGIRFLSAEKGDEKRVGIHLINPTEQESDSAIDTAIAKGFDTIWIHGKLRQD